MRTEARRSALDRLLQTLSWDGASIRSYRQGGAGKENALTTEVLAALDFLPRGAFLGETLRRAHGDEQRLAGMASEIEQAEVTVLGDSVFLRPSAGGSEPNRMVFQPDATIEMPSAHILIEAKRIRSSRFQADQLARCLAVAHVQASGRAPLVLLVLGSPPPVNVEGRGRIAVADSIAEFLPHVAERCDADLDPASMLADVPRTLAWITWQEIARIAAAQLDRVDLPDPSMTASIGRLVETITSAVALHS
jgi:hypothetical protein